ncbi:MAG: thioesterase family protein [Prevotella sp.]
MLTEGISHTSTLTVEAVHTAAEMGSGDMSVLATPAMVALMENSAMKCVAPFLEEGQTTVGAHIASSHLAPTAPGETVCATAILVKAEGRRLSFRVEARQGDKLIGEGEHTRYIVDRVKFLSRL